MRDEVRLLQAAQAFDLDCLAEIYDRYSPGLFAYALRQLGDEHLAEDCVAETFSRFLMAVRAGKGPGDYLQAYLYRIAHNWISDSYRRGPAPMLELDENLAGGDQHKPDVQAEANLEGERVRAALRNLTAEQRQVITLKFLEGWENDEIAAAVQKPVGAVKALQHRALASLRRLLLPADKGMPADKGIPADKGMPAEKEFPAEKEQTYEPD
jgi:RNA polymerase sigma-70 factor (ECF subfamily)